MPCAVFYESVRHTDMIMKGIKSFGVQEIFESLIHGNFLQVIGISSLLADEMTIDHNEIPNVIKLRAKDKKKFIKLIPDICHN